MCESYITYWLIYFLTDWESFIQFLNLQKCSEPKRPPWTLSTGIVAHRLFPCAVPHWRVRWDGSLTSLSALSSSQVSEWEQIYKKHLQASGPWRKVSTIFTYGIYILMLAELWFCEYHGSLNYRLEPETINFPLEFNAKLFSCWAGYFNWYFPPAGY